MLDFLQNELLALLENVHLRTRLQMYYQLDGTPPHFTSNITQYQNEQLPDRKIGRGRPQNGHRGHRISVR